MASPVVRNLLKFIGIDDDYMMRIKLRLSTITSPVSLP